MWARAGVGEDEAASALSGVRELFDPSSRLDPNSPERDAILKIIEYDLLPDVCSETRKTLGMAGESERPEDNAIELDLVDPRIKRAREELVSKPGYQDALRFSKRLELIPSDDQRVRARFDRLQELPLVREVSSRVSQDESYRELASAMEPCYLQLYSAARTALLRADKKAKANDPNPSASGVTIEFNLFQLIGAILVVVVLISVWFQTSPVPGVLSTLKDRISLESVQEGIPTAQGEFRSQGEFQGPGSSAQLPMYGLSQR